MLNDFDVERLEKENLMAVAVHISGLGSSGGRGDDVHGERQLLRCARVSSSRRWRANETLEIESLPATPRPRARDVSLEAQSDGFVIGLEFSELSGRWVVNTPVISGKPLQG